MGPGMFDGIIKAFMALLVVGFVLGAVAMWALPKLWYLLKPLIHGWTS